MAAEAVADVFEKCKIHFRNRQHREDFVAPDRHVKFAPVDEIFHQSRLPVGLQNKWNAPRQFHRVEDDGITADACGAMFVDRLDDCGEPFPPDGFAGLKDAPGGRGDAGRVEQSFDGGLVLRKRQGF